MLSSRLISKELQFLFVLAAIQFNHIVDFMLMMPLGPQLMRDLHINPAQFGYLVSSYTFSAAASGLLCSLFTDRYDRKNLLLFLSVGFSLGTAFCGYAESYWLLLVARSVAGAFGGVLGAVVLAIVGDGVPYERRGFAMGIMSTAFSAASILGVPLSLFVAQTWSWNFSFYLLSILAAILIVFIYLFVPHQKKHIKTNVSTWAPLVNIYNNPHLLVTLLFAAALVLGHFIIIPFLSPSLVANEGLLEHQLPYVYFFGGVVTLITGPLMGRMSDVYGKRRVFFWGVICAAGAIFFVTHIYQTPLWWTLIISTFFFVSTNARWIPAQAMITGSVHSDFRGSFMNYISVIQHLMAGVGALLSGVIVYQTPEGRLMNYHVVGYIAIGVSLFAYFLSQKVQVVERKE